MYSDAGTQASTAASEPHQRVDLAEELEFIVDAIEQSAAAGDDHLTTHELDELRQRFSLVINGSLVHRVEQALLLAMKLDAIQDPLVSIDDSLALPGSWVETYETFADLDDPPFAFVLAEQAARILHAESRL
jgi:hypothetical protein